MKKIFRKIHLWLSVPFGLIITLVCFSGAMLVFENEANEWFRRDLYYVETVKESPLPMDKLLEKVATTLPDSVSVKMCIRDRVKNNGKTVSSNIDFYSGFVYEMIGLPQEIFTPLFAMARIVGWCAHLSLIHI